MQHRCGILNICALLGLFVPAACSLLSSTETGALSLLVLDQASRPVSSAEIRIDSRTLKRTTDDAGFISIRDLESDNHILRIATENYALFDTTITISTGTTLDLTVTLVSLPGELSIVALENVPSLPPVRDLHVLVYKADESTLAGEGYTDADGVLTLAALPAGNVIVAADATLNMSTDPVETEVLSNQVNHIELRPTRFASLLSGTIDFHTLDENLVGLYQCESNGTNVRFIGVPKWATRDYWLRTSVHGYFGTVTLGNAPPFEFAYVFSPFYDASQTFLETGIATLKGWVDDARPRDGIEFTTVDFPIELYCAWAGSDGIFQRREIYHWYMNDLEEWKYELVWANERYDVLPSMEWNGEVQNLPELPVDQDGELYSWALISVTNTGTIKMSFDYFFWLRETDASVSRTAIQPILSEEMRVRLETYSNSSRLERYKRALTTLRWDPVLFKGPNPPY
ncbi:hypothetical protein ACFL3H_08290 [Gemmatimonadota bacterium]